MRLVTRSTGEGLYPTICNEERGIRYGVPVARKEARPRQRLLRLLFLCYVDTILACQAHLRTDASKKPSLCSVSPSRKRRRCVMFSPTLLLSGALVVIAATILYEH